MLLEDRRLPRSGVPDPRIAAGLLQLFEVSEPGQQLVWPVPATRSLLRLLVT